MVIKKTVKWIGIVVGLVVISLGAFFFFIHIQTENIATAIHEDPSLELAINIDASMVKEGQRLTQLKGCFDCHGTDLGGKVYIQDPAIGTFAGSNLTSGKGGVALQYQAEDWVRAIRFGRGPQKTYLKFMPSEEFHAMSDEDLAKMIAFIQSAPAVDRDLPPIQVGPMAKVLNFFGQMPLLFSGHNIDMAKAPPVQVAVSEDSEYGRYLAASCVGCHNPQYSGGPIKGVPPEWPAASNLTPSGAFAQWSFEDFSKFLKTGENKEGRSVNPQFMPWTSTAAMSETELKALFNYLKSLAPVDTGK